ncbi:MAG: type VI secretion system contractile sheath large subunit [Stellaceae bacterium]
MAAQQKDAGTETARTVEAEAQEVNLLDQAIAATRQTEPERAQELMRVLTEEALKGTVVYSRNLTQTINSAIAAIDAVVSKQLSAIMHHPRFQQLEGAWRGLHYLVSNSETGPGLKIRVLNLTKRELFNDLSKQMEFDQSLLFKKIYENEFGMPGGEPYGALIGDYEFNRDPHDIEALSMISNVAAAAFAPFITAASPQLLGLENFTELPAQRSLAKIFDTVEYAKWRSFRESDDSRFVTLTMPRVLARLPYGKMTNPIEEFDFEEAPTEGSKTREMPHDHFTWMNSAYAMAARMTESFARSGFCTSIRGAENGGKVSNLPAYDFVTDDGDRDLQCPTEIAIGDRREKELSDLGFLPLCHYKNTDYAVFFGGQSVHKPKKYSSPDDNANAALSARLPYLMATSRFAHFLKVIARDKIGSFMEREDCEAFLNKWISNYVNSNPNASAELKAQYPLREAQVEVQEVAGMPGSYQAVARLRPWLQMEELTASLRLVARVPKKQ